MLFGHLASRFSTQPENLATEAVAFIVDRSAAMREALRRLVGRTGIEFDNTQFGCAPFVPDALKAWSPPRLFVQNGRALIPLTLMPNVPRDKVLGDLPSSSGACTPTSNRLQP